MILAPLKPDQEKEALIEEQQRKNEEKSSGGIWHDVYFREGEKEMEHLRQKPEKQKKSDRMQQIFQSKNAYGEVSLGMNEKGETMLVADRERYMNGPSVVRNQKILDEKNTYYWRGKAGNRLTNLKDPAMSAFAMSSTKQHEGESRENGWVQLTQSMLFARQTMQQTALSMLPQKAILPGETKTQSVREHKLSHEINIALEEGRKRIVRKRGDDLFLRRLQGLFGMTNDEDNREEEDT